MESKSANIDKKRKKNANMENLNIIFYAHKMCFFLNLCPGFTNEPVFTLDFNSLKSKSIHFIC